MIQLARRLDPRQWLLLNPPWLMTANTRSWAAMHVVSVAYLARRRCQAPFTVGKKELSEKGRVDGYAKTKANAPFLSYRAGPFGVIGHSRTSTECKELTHPYSISPLFKKNSPGLTYKFLSPLN